MGLRFCVPPSSVPAANRKLSDGSTIAVGLDGPNGYERLPLPERTPGWESFWIDDFLAGSRPAVSAEDAETITRISLAARESAVSGAAVLL